jgi:hypothetical protein
VDLIQGQQRFPFLIEDDGGKVVIEQHPLAVAVRAAGQERFKRIVPGNANAAAAVVSQQRIHFRDPLRVGRTA